MNWSRCAGQAADPEHDRAGFTTLAVPFFFTMLFAAWLIAGPITLLAAPVIFRLALVVVPPPSRLSLPSCPYLARCDAERAALRVGTVAATPVRDVVRSTAPPAAAPTPSALIVAAPAPATSADARVESPRRAA